MQTNDGSVRYIMRILPYRTVDNEYSWLAATDLVRTDIVDEAHKGLDLAATARMAKSWK